MSFRGITLRILVLTDRFKGILGCSFRQANARVCGPLIAARCRGDSFYTVYSCKRETQSTVEYISNGWRVSSPSQVGICSNGHVSTTFGLVSKSGDCAFCVEDVETSSGSLD